MEKNDVRYSMYTRILNEELVPAMGCTEPIALAYGAARAREVLGYIPESIRVIVCGNIIKNVKSVIVPNTGGLKGIEAAIASGVVAGDASAMLEVLADIDDKGRKSIEQYLASHRIKIEPATNGLKFYIELIMSGGGSNVRLVIANYHTNIILIEKDDKIIFKSGQSGENNIGLTDRSVLSVEGIVDYADTVELQDIEDVIRRQIEFNYAISREGLENAWGAQIGRVLLNSYPDDIKIRARAAAAAGSDARMSGCDMPVIIVSGSGNQGITASVPIIVYARELKLEEERLFRALVVSNLVTIHQKTGIGRLSAFCGAVSAGCGAGAGIAYLLGGDYKVVAHTIVNSLAIVSGMICDGAKPSCAAKIAEAVDAGLLGYCMYNEGQQFLSGDGIVTKGVDNTISNVGRMVREGMRETDAEILRIMVGD